MDEEYEGRRIPSPWRAQLASANNLLAARSAAAELGEVGLAEALELLLLIGEQEPGKYDRAAVRRQARYCRQMPDVAPGEGQALLGLLLMLAGSRRETASRALVELLDRRGLERAAGGADDGSWLASPERVQWREVRAVPESGLPIRVYHEHDVWHVDYADGVVHEYDSREEAESAADAAAQADERTVVVEE